MSAVVCGSKRSFFEDIPSPPVSKRIRCSSTSPIRLSPPSLVDQLRSIFPLVELQILERALEECGNDLDLTIRSLQELHFASAEEKSGSAEEFGAEGVQGTLIHDREVAGQNPSAAAAENPSAAVNGPSSGAEWVELLVREMMSATSVDNAKDRASRVLEILEKSISACVGEETSKSFQKEIMVHKEQIEALIRENAILKRAVSIQHERQKAYEDRIQEVQHLKQLLAQYQEQLRTLEINNYALTMHLRQAQQSSSIPGRFHPDIF